jgi:hypothetical protein
LSGRAGKDRRGNDFLFLLFFDNLVLVIIAIETPRGPGHGFFVENIVVVVQIDIIVSRVAVVIIEFSVSTIIIIVIPGIAVIVIELHRITSRCFGLSGSDEAFP